MSINVQRLLVCKLLLLWMSCTLLHEIEGANSRELKVEDVSASSYDYFDRWRNDPLLPLTTIQLPPPAVLVDSNNPASVNSNVIQVTTATITNDTSVAQKNETFRLVHLATFLPLSNGTHVRSAIRNTIASTLLAIHHFNNNNDNNKECNIRLTTEIVDSQLDPFATVTRLSELMNERTLSLATPIPSAVVGAYRSATTLPLALLAATRYIAQISPSATSLDLDNKETYPLFVRTAPSAAAEAAAAVAYYHTYLQVQHVAVLFVTDTFGASLAQSFQALSRKHGMRTYAVGFSYSAPPQLIARAVQSLQRANFRYIFAIGFDDHYAAILSAAVQADMIGKDFSWIFYGLSIADFHRYAIFPRDSPYYQASKGIGIMGFTDGPSDQILFAQTDNHISLPSTLSPQLQNTRETERDKFQKAWRSAISDPQMVEYIQTKIPSNVQDKIGFDPEEPFGSEPSTMSHFLYDAIRSMGYAMCASNKTFFNGADIVPYFQTLDFDGASGRVKFNEFGSREGSTVEFQVWNVRDFGQSYNGTAVATDEKSQLALVPSIRFQNGLWKDISGKRFVYADGTTFPPNELPALDVKMERISALGLSIGYALMAGSMFLSVMCVLWILYHRNEAVVRATQLEFLILLVIGSMISASAVFPLSLQEPRSQKTLDAACMAMPWLFFIGIVVTFGTLFAKTLCILKACNSTEIVNTLVTPIDFAKTIIPYMALNILILVVWNVRAPLQWIVETDESTDAFGRPLASHGNCGTDDGAHSVYLIILVCCNITVLVAFNYLSYRLADLQSEYHEHEYISLAYMSGLEIFVVGMPFLAIVQESPGTFYLIGVLLSLFSSPAILLIIVVPKVWIHRKIIIRHRRMEEMFRSRSSQSQRDTSESRQSTSQRGIRILTKEAENEMSQGSFSLSMGRHQLVRTATEKNLGLILAP